MSGSTLEASREVPPDGHAEQLLRPVPEPNLTIQRVFTAAE